MKITALEINNIASIDGCYQIDFEKEPLNSVGLFAITGATGAGKSTILDSICLALYNKTPRLAPLTATVQIYDTKDKTISNKDVKTLLRKGAINGHVKVTFIGVDGKYYRSEWNIRRANNRITGTIQSEEIILYQVTDNTVFPEKRKTFVLNEIERLIGLKYEQFTKSVILAQGEFTSFLKADDNNRADILEKLTGTDIYSKISKKVFDNYRIQKIEVEKLNTKLEMFQLFSDEDIDMLTNEIVLLNQQINEFKSQLNSANSTQEWYKKEHVLLDEIDKITFELNQRKQQLIAEKNRIEHFEIVEKFQEIKDVVVSYNQKKNESVNQQLDLKNTLESIEKRQVELNELAINVNNLNVQFREIQNQINANAPLYQQARKLDFLIESQQKNQLEKTAVVDEFTLKNSALEIEFQQKKESANSLIVQQNQLNAWFEQNRIYETFVANENLVLAFLKEAEKNKNEIPKEEQELQKLDLQRNELQPVLEIKEIEKKKLELRENENSNQLQELNAKLQDQNISEIEESRKQLHATRELKIQQLEFFKSLHEQQELVEESNVLMFDLENKQLQLKAAVIETEDLLNASKIKKETLEIVLEKMRLEKSANVVLLRENLIENEPCPVCGSEDHPYFTHNPLSKITDETTKLYTDLEEKIEVLNKKQATLNQQLIQISEQILQTTETKNKALKIADKIEKETTEISFPNADLKAFEKYQSIANDLKALATEIQTKETQLDLLRKQWFEKEQLQGNTVVLQQNIQSITKEIYELSTQIAHLNHKKQSFAEGIEQKKLAYHRQIADVTNILQNNLWFDLWFQNPGEFAIVHSRIAQNWRAYQSSVEKLTEKQIEIKTEIQELEKHLELKNIEIEKAKNDVLLVQNEVAKSRADRQKYFDGETVDFIEQNLNNTFVALTENIDKQKQIIIERNNELIVVESNKKALEENLNKSVIHLAENEKTIKIWASQMQFSFEKVFELIVYNTEWIQNERSFIQNLHTQISKQEALFEDKHKALENHTSTNKPEISEVEIVDRIREIDENIKTANEKALANKHQLQTDSEQRKSQSDLIEKKYNLLKIATKWSQLNDLIGSADGAKFKKIAQEYTLDILLRYANIHLEKINRRYTLERIPTTLSLQVIDNDMACELRSVHSLSGGESFLVSLALALALSSLSSSKMNIQSLFIDEGFGTLDAQTLSVAMDALESLQNQGKKVGVISHVSEMTERISVQIHVEKHGNGRSSIEIINL